MSNEGGGARHDQHCDLCGLRNGDHRCLACNSRYPTLDELIEHQKKRQHVGGHYILERAGAGERRRRRLPARLRSDNDNAEAELAADAAAGSNTLDALPSLADDEAAMATEEAAVLAGDEVLEEAADGDGPDDDARAGRSADSDADAATAVDGAAAMASGRAASSLPTLDAFFKRKRASSAAADAPSKSARQSDGQSSPSSGASAASSSAPTWATKLQNELGGFTFNSDFTTYTCACGVSGSNVSSKESNAPKLEGSNARAHRRSQKYRFDKNQPKLGEKRKPKLQKSEFREKLANFIVDTASPFRIVEYESFEELVLSGAGREHLEMPSRRTVGRDIDKLYNEVYEHLKKALAEAESRISITFDLWTDKRTRGYIGITGHFFDRELVLRAPLLAIQSMPKTEEGHTAARIVETVSAVLQDLLGDDWKEKLNCAVTDGARNVTAASMQIGESRRCVQHGLQLFLKYFCATQRDVASAMACCNYLAKLSGLSQKFKAHVGTITAGVVTRWNSYIKSACDVFNRADKIRNFANSAQCTGESKEAMKARLKFLDDKGGFEMLHDLIVLLKPLMDITIDEEVELFITSSAVVPRLSAAKTRIDEILANAALGDDCDGQILNTARVKNWQPLVNDLWDQYLAGFVDDDLFLCAAMLDARAVCTAVVHECTVRRRALF